MARVEVNGGAVDVHEQGSGPAFFLIHGAGSDGGMWAEDAAWLAESWRFITYDRRGYQGSSESPRDWAAHTDDAIALLEKLDAAPAVVAGYSAGAMAALGVCVQRPELVERLVLIDPVVHPRKSMTPGLAATFVRMQLARRVRGAEAGMRVWMPYVTSHSTGGSLWTSGRMRPERRERVLGNGEGVFADLGSRESPALTEEAIRAIDKPVAIIGAGLSPSFIKRSIERLRELLPRAEFAEVAEAGHVLAFEQPEEFRRVLTEALTPVAS